MGGDGESGAPADRHGHRVLARHLTGGPHRPSIHELITEREAVASAAAERIRDQIAALSEQLAAAETELADLAITRSTLIRLTGEPDTGAPADTTIASPAYQQILAVVTAATAPMRAKDVCRALGTATTPKDTEGMRAKLKRLVNRQILTASEPGLFTLATPAPPA